MMTIS